jgi:DNA-binding beta-propeller fold protein YncE
MIGGDRVYKFSPKGATLARWGTSGADAGRFFTPAAIAIDTHNNIYVADTGNNRLQELSPRGLPIAIWPVTSPTSVAVDARGTIYVGSCEAHYVGGSLSFLLRKPAHADALTPWITTGKGVGDPPNALAVDARGNVYLTGGGNNVGVI